MFGSGLLGFALVIPGTVGAGTGKAVQSARKTKETSRLAAVSPYSGMPEERGEWKRLLWLDFGEPGFRAPGAIGVHPENSIPGSTWVRGMVRTFRNPAVSDPYLGDVALGTDAVFRLATEPEVEYLAVLTLGVGDTAAAPLEVWESGGRVAENIVPPREAFVEVVFPARSKTGELAIRIRAAGCGTFALAGLALYRKGNVSPHPRFVWGAREEGEIRVEDPVVPRDVAGWVPPPAGEPAARALLRACCEYLLAERLSEGGYAASGSWYESSFPVRALLAGAEILGLPRDREAALECVDRFVDEQKPDGGWSSGTFGRTGCGHLRFLPGNVESANLADVGSMALALLAGARAAEPERRDRYLAAARRYADGVVLPHQLESGAFPNLLFLGTEYGSPYSVATGIQASVLSGLFAATGEERYRAAAERGALFLAAEVDSSGEMRFHRHDREHAQPIPSAGLGDVYYVIEGLLSTLPWTEGDARAAIQESLRRYFEGQSGLFAAMGSGDWWRVSDVWEGSKQAGSLFLIDQYLKRSGGGEEGAEWRERALALLSASTPPFGVLGDPAGPRGRLALVATGFAGLGAASVLDPSAVVPAPRAGRP